MEEMNELTAEERARILQHELEAVGSSSYKIGRASIGAPCEKGAGVPCPQRPGHQRQISVYLREISQGRQQGIRLLGVPAEKRTTRGAEKWFLETNYTHTPLDLEHPKSFSEKTSGSSCTAGSRMSIPSLTSMPCASGSRRRSARNTLFQRFGCLESL